jgi:hypothetical protein
MPALRTGIKERDYLSRLWINGRDVASLEAITQGARVSQVVRFSSATMLFRNHVIDFMDQHCIIGMDQAILAAFPGSGYHLRAQL